TVFACEAVVDVRRSRPGMVPMAAGSRISSNGRVGGPPRRPTRRKKRRLVEGASGRAHDQETSPAAAAFGRGPTSRNPRHRRKQQGKGVSAARDAKKRKHVTRRHNPAPAGSRSE